jgi:hypothetical protein
MTTSQKLDFYLPAWRKTAAALGWHGRTPATRLPSHGHGLANTLYQAVWDAATELAWQQMRAVHADDLRHACSFVATSDLWTKSQAQLAATGRKIPGARGANSSSKSFTTAETNHVVRLFRVLLEPDNLTHWIAWNNPEEADRQSVLISLLDHADEAYAETIARRRFGRTPEADPTDLAPSKEKLLAEWQTLPMKDLRDLHWVVVQRSRQKAGQDHHADLLKLVEAIHSGYGGVMPNGNVVDRRQHPSAVPIPANPFFKTPAPKPVPNNGQITTDN